MSDEKKAFMMCVLALVVGSIIAMTGCAVGAGARVDGHGAGAAAAIEIDP